MRFRRSGLSVAALTAAVTMLAACSSSTSSKAPAAAGGSSGSSGGKALTIGVIVPGQSFDWAQYQGDIAKSLAAKRGWKTVVLDSGNDGPTLQKDAQTLIADKVDAVIGFFGVPSINPVLAQRFAAAKIPVITYDIAQSGWYFVGVDNAKSGQSNGQALGQAAKTKWNCQVDLVLEGTGAAAGVVDAQRTGGAADGFKSACPDVPASAYQKFETNGNLSVGVPAARNVLSANPSAKHIAVVGINDAAVESALQANEQLGSKADIIGWGQDGSLIGTSGASATMLGSAFYFLEGYPVYAFQILDKIAAGANPPVNDTSANGLLVPPCVVTAAQAATVPAIAQRAAQIESAGKAGYDLFCPKS